jgi:hypothetical protein
MTNEGAVAEMPLDLADGELADEDLARVLISFRGVVAPRPSTKALRYVRRSDDGLAPAYMFDEDSGMIYILD